MNFAITTRGHKTPETLKAYISDKLKRLDRFTDIIMDVEAVVSHEKLDQIVEFKAKLRHTVIRVKEKSEDLYKSVDLAIDSLERQIVRSKNKLKDHKKEKIVEKLES